MKFARWIFACLMTCAATPGQEVKQLPPVEWESTARLIGAEEEITKLHDLLRQQNPDRWEILWLHQRILERVATASLQVDATMAQIDNEIAQSNEVRGFLSDKRDSRVSRVNLLSVIIGGGVGATSSGLQLSSALDKPAAAVGIAAGSASAGLALWGIHAQKGGTQSFDFDSNMLAEFFDRPMLPDSHYPATVWTFLCEAPQNGMGGGSTRREQLLQSWVRLKRIDSLESREKIDHLSSRPEDGLQLTIDDYGDRAAMLADVRARVAYLKRDLGALLASLPETK